MTNTKKRRKLLWGMRMMMRDIELIHGWHAPLRSYMRLYVPNGGEEGICRIHIRRINRIQEAGEKKEAANGHAER